MKVLVTGVRGQLGYDVVNELEKRGLEAIGVDIQEMDITDEASVNSVIGEAAPDAVIHCAAYTAVDAAEDNIEILPQSQCRWYSEHRKYVQKAGYSYDLYQHRLCI